MAIDLTASHASAVPGSHGVAYLLAGIAGPRDYGVDTPVPDAATTPQNRPAR